MSKKKENKKKLRVGEAINTPRGRMVYSVVRAQNSLWQVMLKLKNNDGIEECAAKVFEARDFLNRVLPCDRPLCFPDRPQPCGRPLNLPAQPSPSAPPNILREAETLMTGDRHEDYGPAPVEFERVAKLWSVVLGCAVTPRMAALCMVQLKIAREVHRHKRDNVVDAAAYLQIAVDCERAAREREEIGH